MILISCVVITSLFYPALALYSTSQSKFSIFDNFIPREANPGFQASKDLGLLWDGYNTLRTHDDALTRLKCGAGHALRVERILIQSSLIEDDGALNHRILLSTLELERRLEDLISIGEKPCLKRPDGRCFVLSPLLFWDYDKDALLLDRNILDKLSTTKNISVAGIPITPQMVLAGRGTTDHHVAGPKFDFANFLALTYFFPGSDCFGNSEHTAWLQDIHTASSESATLSVQAEDPKLFALEVNLRPLFLVTFFLMPCAVHPVRP